MDDQRSKIEQGVLSGLVVAVLVGLPLMASVLVFTAAKFEPYWFVAIAWLVIGLGVYVFWRRKNRGKTTTP